MSADPSVQGDSSVKSGGYVIKNVIYDTKGGSQEVKVFSGSWAIDGTRFAEQYTIVPYDANMDQRHPCAVANAELEKCNEAQPPAMKMAGRVATCNEQRKALMVCLNKNKCWEPPARKWYQLW